jgi:hypothetical protein
MSASNHLQGDVQALRYVDALDAADLETVAALWEEAGHDPQLERLLTEIDGAVAEVLARPRRARRRLALWAVLGGAVAAACVFAVLAWPRKDVKSVVPGPRGNEIAVTNNPGLPDGSADLAAWRESRQAVEQPEPPVFRWPLAEPAASRVSTSIPSDLFD